jgi:O-antigen/teichoic acid export membrane protein
MRLKNSVRNLIIAWFGQAVFIICYFVTWGVFARMLSLDNNTIQGLFAPVLSILTISELGIGTAISYALYRPLAEGDETKVRSLMRLFKRAYYTIGISIAVLGLCLTPFIQYLIDGELTIPLSQLHLYFLCFVFNASISYFFSYKAVLIVADQKRFVVSIIQYASQSIMCLVQITILVLTKNYFLFLICMIAFTVAQNVLTAYRANKMYPFLKSKRAIEPLDKATLASIKKNVSALVLHRIATVTATPLSTIIISTGIPYASYPAAVSSYYFYNQVIMALYRIMDQAFEAIIASVGNLAITESKKRQSEVFRIAFFVNAALYTLTAVPLLCLFNIFIDEWVGEQFTMSLFVSTLLTVLYFLKGMRSAGLSFLNAYGLFWQTRYKAVAETVVLLTLGLLLVGPYQITGVVLAGIISTIFVSTFIEGLMLFKHGLKTPSMSYFLHFALYSGVAALLGFVAFELCQLVAIAGIMGLLLKGVLSLVIAAGGFALIFHRKWEFKETMSMLKPIFAILKARLSPKLE